MVSTGKGKAWVLWVISQVHDDKYNIMYVLMIVIHLLSTVGDVNVTDDCCTVKVMELSY